MREFIDIFIINGYSQYFYATLLFIGSALALYIFKVWVLHKLKHLSERTTNKLDDALISVIKDIRWPFYLVVPLFAASRILTLPAYAHEFIYYAFLIIVIYYVVKIAQSLIDFFVKKQVTAEKEESAIVNLLGILIKIALWVIAVILVLSNMGYNVTSLIAGLGIGGIAIALALQNVLSDIFAAFSIHFDKPFVVGDIIQVGDDIGTVKKIGIKTTRIQSLQGEELVVSNQELTSTRIQNFKRMEDRRVVLKFGVTYDTPKDKLELIPEIVKEIITKIELTEFDRAHLVSFGDSSLDFEVVYYALTTEYNVYMDINQRINLSLIERFGKEKIEFAFPTRTVILQK